MKKSNPPILVEMIETGKLNYEIEQSVQSTIAKIPEPSKLDQKIASYDFSQKKKKG